MSDIKHNYAAAIELCRQKNWHYTEDEEHNQIRLGFAVKTKFNGFHLVMDVRENGILTYGILPLRGDKDSEAALLRYITLANFSLIDGNFEYDMRDGEIRYKSYLSACAGLNGEAIDRSIGCVVSMVERYGNGFAGIIFGGADPEDEIHRAEADSPRLPNELLHRLGRLEDPDGEDAPCSDEEQREILRMIGLPSMG